MIAVWILGVCLVGLVATFGSGQDAAKLGFLLIVILGALQIFVSFDQERKRKRDLDEQIEGLITLHLDELARQRLSLVRLDPYGSEVTKNWQKEIVRFVEAVLIPAVGKNPFWNLRPGREMSNPVAALIEQRAKARAGELAAALAFDETMSPIEFERYCSELLGKSGWQAQTTKASSDQGCDVIASRDGHRIILQCKLYSRPLGNKAVQEAHAAKSHYCADHAAVVSNAPYTAQAKQLAQTTGVLLLHYSHLQQLDDLLQQARFAQQAASTGSPR